MKDIKKQKETEAKNAGISRRDAMRKMGFTAFSAASMLLLLNEPGKAQDEMDSFYSPGDPGDF